ncbi:uncharacterized protein [Magallana gigas]|uniref:uncharacterized protein isoform X2 n=1 Tax=Magallana gigas TaxID=29159 RepID=UPI00148A90EF|nr:uncharacterized protein LOC105344072 isoform X2 [Crassostrea gigas]
MGAFKKHLTLYLLFDFFQPCVHKVGETVWRTTNATFLWAGFVTGLLIPASASMDTPAAFAKQPQPQAVVAPRQP